MTNINNVKEVSVKLKPEEITSKDILIAWLRFYFADEIPHSFDRYIAPALLWALIPALKKLYKDKDELRAAYQRHLLFFNTQISWGGGIITGLMLSMEKERAQQVYNKEEITVTDDLIYNIKAGLMGALAGIGDSIDSGTVQYIFIAIAIPWAQQGLAIGAVFPFLAFSLYQVFIGLFFTRQGFKMGLRASELLEGSKVQSLIELLSILGLFMMGVLAANYVKVSSSLSFNRSESSNGYRSFNLKSYY
jgi:mannose/fructose/N-acetylgalactosamine-specific phosphotransferase system component IID